MGDRGTVLCLVRIALAVVEVGGEVRNDAHSDDCSMHIALVVVAAVGASVLELGTAMMTDTHTVPWVHIALVGAVAVATVVEAERGVIETEPMNDTHTAHCSVHTALALALADIHPYTHSRVVDSFGARN